METRIRFSGDANYINIEVTYEKNATYTEVRGAADKALSESSFNDWSIFEFNIDSPTQTTFLAGY